MSRLRSGPKTPSLKSSLLIALAGLSIVLAKSSGFPGVLPLAALPFAGDSSFTGISIVGLIFGLVLSALYVGAETALDLLRPMHLKFAREKGPKRGERLQWLMDHRANIVAACILGRQTVKLTMVFFSLMLGEVIANATSPDGTAPAFSTAALYGLGLVIPVGLISVVLDLVPKSYASLHPHRVAFRLHGFMRASWGIFGLPASFITAVANLLTSRFGGEATFEIQNPVEEEIKTIVESAEESGEIEVDERELLHSVFEFTDTVAREIMTPRVDLDAMPVKSDPQEIIRVIEKTGHSRIPLYEDTDDQIVGVIHAKDLLKAATDNRGAIHLRRLMRPALFVPENKSLHDLLKDMRHERTQLAVVQDEFGGTAGIVTVEDIVEELLGDIVDEYDVEEPEIVADHGVFYVEGKAHVDDVNAALGSDFESEEFDTIGGFVFGLFGRQPTLGECIDSGGWRFCVVETDGRRIAKLRIERVDLLDAMATAEVAD